jgi:hypothetical protein
LLQPERGEFFACLHRTYSTPAPRDTIYHQRQAILRNSSSPEDGLLLLLRLLWSDYYANNHICPLLAAVAAIFCIAAFTTAGSFSSQISTAIGNKVLLKANNCGRMQAVSSSQNIKQYFKVAFFSQRTG